MPTKRHWILAAALVLGTAGAIRHQLVSRPAADPCDVNPGLHACAVFLQPDWLKRRVYAGRPDLPVTVGPKPSASVAPVDVLHRSGPSIEPEPEPADI